MIYWIVGIGLIVLFLYIVLSGNEKEVGTKSESLETAINNMLSILANQLGGKEFHDIMLEHNHVTCQIDNVFLSNKALYVIEAKDYSGWIYGSEYQENWRQTFAHYRSRDTGETVSRYSFYNPIKQNQEHIRILIAKFDHLDEIPTYNLVVFGEFATLNNINIYKSNTLVINMNRLYYTILGIDEKLTKKFNLNFQANFVDQLMHENIIDKQQRLAHIKRIQNKYHNNEINRL